ncbi:hypothetical protein [Leptolyngbya sp. FACHB-541]|uniref:hypothetical protein n=1 Tax=Leptolyngbya sp. FACHB-541 TaxID=2692810 RepID=UPI0016893B93|nr:hypothetical protein [Leptolyngbya sp. FACHB-541]
MNVQDTPKALTAVEGANHYSITNQDSDRDPIRPTLDQTLATEAIGRWSGLFLRSHLLHNQDAFDYVYSTGDNLDPNVSVISQTPLG